LEFCNGSGAHKTGMMPLLKRVMTFPLVYTTDGQMKRTGKTNSVCVHCTCKQ